MSRRTAFGIAPCIFCSLIAIMAVGSQISRAQEIAVSDYFQDAAKVESVAKNGDTAAQRRHIWNVLSFITQSSSKGGHLEPLFESWHGEGELFDSVSEKSLDSGIRGFSRRTDAPVTGESEADVPVISYTLYNGPAYQHIRSNDLNEQKGLERQLKNGHADSVLPNDRTVPAFPARSIVLKTVWWPVAREGVTPLPIWNPGENQPSAHGNPYTTWSRVVGVNPSKAFVRNEHVSIDFAGRSFRNVSMVGLESFYHLTLDTSLAERLMRDPEALKTSVIVLGRPLREGDYIVFVSGNLMTREISNWVWATFWWHDRPNNGPFSQGRPEDVKSYWRNYLMQAAFDTETPRESGGGAHVAFNPWLEGRFPDGGHGNGMTSNCMACHERASYPKVGFLPVTRGTPDFHNDKAFAAGRLMTSFLWSLPLHAKP